jgi:hypothetical protein
MVVSGISFFFFFLFLSLMCDTDSEKIGNGFVYNAEQKHIIGKVDIPPTIISYDYNNDFIVAKQKPKKYNEAIYDEMEYVYPLGRDTVYYWLIIKEKQKIVGPLDYDDFLLLKRAYKVPNNLKLQ